MELSTDYIDWMMAPPREGFRRRLNKEKEKVGWHVGDWAILIPRYKDQRPFVLTKIALHESRGTTDDGDTVSVMYLRHRAQWLPGLGQLLGMIRDLPDLEWFEAEALDNRQAWEFRGALEGEIGQAALDKHAEIAASELLAKLWGVE